MTASRWPAYAAMPALCGLLLGLCALAVAQTWAVNGQTYRLQRANLHIHTGYSCAHRGAGQTAPEPGALDHFLCGMPKETAAAAAGAGLDVVGFSDHCFQIDEYEWGWKTDYERSLRRAALDGKHPLCLVGFEWTPCTNDHVNVFGLGKRLLFARVGNDDTGRAIPRHPVWPGIIDEGDTPDRDGERGKPAGSADFTPDFDALAKRLARLMSKGARPVCQFNHPWMIGRDGPSARLRQFRACSQSDRKVLRDVFALLEVGGGLRGLSSAEQDANDNAESYWQDALRVGWHCAPTMGEDNQTLADIALAGEAYTGVWTQNLDGLGDADAEEATLDALRSRRVFATRDKGAWAWMVARYAGQAYPMGSVINTLPGNGACGLSVTVGGLGSLSLHKVHLVEVTRDAANVIDTQYITGSGPKTLDWSTTPDEATLCWYIRVTTLAEDASPMKPWVLLTAPIWLDAESPAPAGGASGDRPGTPNPLDVVLVIDRTTSMQDDIDVVKRNANQLTHDLIAAVGDVRVAVVTYGDRDDGPGHVVSRAFSHSTAEVADAINSITLSGGGDTPEDVFDGLSAAVSAERLGRWREGATHLVVLMGDAPQKRDEAAGLSKLAILGLRNGVFCYCLVAPNPDGTTASCFGRVAKALRGKVLTDADVSSLARIVVKAGSVAELQKANQTPDPGTGWEY